MLTRVAPLRLKLSLIGSRTLVARTISSLSPFKALPTRVSLSPRLYTSAVSMKLIPLSRATFTIRVASSWPRLPMFILPPNCIVPRATLTQPPKTGPSRMRVLPNPEKENRHERHATQRRADHRDPEARRSRIDHDGVMPTAGDYGADLLPLEGEVRWDGEWRREEDEATGGREPEAEACGGGSDAG